MNPKLAKLLGEGYRSTEQALKELVDNAWDADAETVRVDLPRELSDDPVVVADDGSGMTLKEVESEYLAIADGRRHRRGDTTPFKKRKVKGRKGIGKFAGLMVASEMHLETTANGTTTSISIRRNDLDAATDAGRDLETIDLGVRTRKAAKGQQGTKVTLVGLNRKLQLPSPEKLRAILVREYGREDDFKLVVGGERVGVPDIQGETYEKTFQIPELGEVTVQYTLSDENVKNPGLSLKVDGKVIGKPDLLGLNDEELLPPKLARRVYGEIVADGLVDEVTADFGAIIENSKAHQELRRLVHEEVREKIETKFKTEVSLAKARHQKEINRRLEALPEHRRSAARSAVERIYRKFFGEREDRVEAILDVTLEAFETDDYWAVVSRVAEATRADIGQLAEALQAFGLVDMAVMGKQAQRRLGILDQLDRLIEDEGTVEQQVHAVIETNPWILGNRYSLLRSNQTLKKVLGDLVEKSRKGKRPDLLLASLPDGSHLLVEFKRPSHSITRDDENQAEKYRDDLSKKFPSIDVLMIGKQRSGSVNPHYTKDRLEVQSWAGVVSTARNEVTWLLEHLKKDQE